MALRHVCVFFGMGRNTVDGTNPAPVEMVNIPLFTRLYVYIYIYPRWLLGIPEPSTV